MVIIEHICKERKKEKKVSKKNKKKRKRKMKLLPSFGISQHDLVAPPAVPTIGGKNKSPQKLFHRQTMLLHHVSHYRSMAFLDV